MSLKLYNTLTRTKESFKPLVVGSVKMYNCGPTVYNYAHIGNFRAFICSDILKRYLQYKNYTVLQVMNITDVDDKTIRDAQKEKKSLQEFCDFYTQAFLGDMQTLSISKPDIMPRATEHIKEMVALIKKLIEKGIAYKADDGIYYSVEKFKEYGKLSHVKLTKTKHGKRCANDEYDKENAHDFALWKFWDTSDGDVFWETDLGKGRPGWHIECSAMSTKYLGNSFDIHTGGIDLIFPHHENEIAQIEPVTEKQFVRHWLHNEYILVDGKKMSKSLGNFYTLRDILQKGYKPEAIRYLLLSTHYRTQCNFTLQGLDAAQQSVDRLKEFTGMLKRVRGTNPIGTSVQLEIESSITKLQKNFEKAMDDDLNTSEALAAIFEAVSEIYKIYQNNLLKPADAAAVLTCFKKLDSILAVLEQKEETIPDAVTELAEQREAARKKKDFKAADHLREKIAKLDYVILDTPEGYMLKKK